MNKLKILLLFILITFVNINCTPVEEERDTPTLPSDEIETEVELEGDIFILQNNTITLQFKKVNNDRLKLVNFSSGDHYWINTDLYSKDPLWNLSIYSPTSNTEYVLNSDEVNLKKVTKKSSKSNHLIFHWEYTRGGAVVTVVATISLNNSTGLSEWDLEVHLPEKWEISNVNYPMLNIKKDAGMHLITSSNWGADYDLDKISNLKLPLTYPSSRATVQLMCLNNNGRTLYFATHDKHANLKTFTAQISFSKVNLSIETVASHGWSKDNTFSLPWTTQLGIHNNGWENAVLEWYRPFALSTEWGKKSLNSKNIPQWLSDTDLWLHGGRTGQDEFNGLSHTLEYFGNDTKFHWYYWSSHEFDTDYPEYFPPREKYNQIVDIIHEHGSRVMPYTNGRLWDIATASYHSQNGSNEVVLKKNKEPYIEKYASGAQNAVVCPSSEIWKEILIKFTQDILSGSIKNDALYFDQVASALTLPCYNENHDHPMGGGDFWHYSFREIFSILRNYVGSDQIICTEQNAECYLDLFDLFLMGNTPMGSQWLPAPLFPLIYSDRVLTYGFYLNNPSEPSDFRAKNALTLLWGGQLNGGRSVVYTWGGDWPNNAAYLNGLKTFRKDHHDLFVGGRFMGEYLPSGDNPDLVVDGWERPSKAVRGARWISTRGSEAILLVNIDTENHEIILPNGIRYILKKGECYRHNL